MSDQRWPNTKLEREWLALCFHMQGLLGKGCWINIEPTVGNEVALMSEMTSRQRHLSTSGYQHYMYQQNANVGPPTDCNLGCPELTTNVYVTYARSYS